jgi:hypothetical protein
MLGAGGEFCEKRRASVVKEEDPGGFGFADEVFPSELLWESVAASWFLGFGLSG